MNPEIIEHTGDGGYFRIFATPPGGKRTEITMFRDVPTTINSFSSTDPFGDATASMTFPAITGFDRPGYGDMHWYVPWANVDIRYYHADGTLSNWAWEGMFASEDISDEPQTISLKGALYQADNYQAAPWFPQYPIPYELLIKEALDPKKNPSLRTAPLRIEFPDDWNITVPKFNNYEFLWFLRPYGVSTGQKWTGLTTRNTGGWEPLLTGFIQTLLSVMYTEDSQWTISKRTGRVPVLHVRPHLSRPGPDTYQVSFGSPGVKVALSRDFTQSANVVYVQGSDLNGTVYSGQHVSPDGQRTSYEPYASLPYVHPNETSNARLNRNIVRKESRLQLPAGMDQDAARDTAAAHLRRFADPGYTGSITLTSDPMTGNGLIRSRYLIKGGEQIVVNNLRGASLLLHISEASVSMQDGSVTLSVDSKFRDALTVAEVKARTRDALDPVRLLQVGKFSTTVQDLILPWSYSEGSGVIPSGGEHDATPFFVDRLGETSRFPWTDFTTKYPPRRYPKYYIKVNPHNSNADKNWGNLDRDGIARGFPIRMSQGGGIRLLQLAAYDENGNVVPVRFHFSIYNNSGVTSRDMPRITRSTASGIKDYKEGQAYPFYQDAFERLNNNGTETTNPLRTLHDTAGLVVGWGNYYEEAGYFPGKFSAGGKKTGLLVDESPWSFDTTMDPDFDKYSVRNTREATTTGRLYGMIYADYHGKKPIYFMGRMWRTEPGA